MRILGIDPGTRVLGYGLLEDGGAVLERVASGTLEANPRASRIDRLRTIGAAFRDLLESTRPDEVAVEQAFYGRNPSTLLALGEGRGVVLFCAAERGVPIHEYSPAEVKKAITGRGSARKEQVAEMVRALVRPVPEEGRHDETDALAVAACHAQRRHLREWAGGASESHDVLRLRVTGGRVRRGRGR